MKRIFAALPVLFLMAACGGDANKETTTTTEQTEASQVGTAFTIDTTATQVSWKAAHKGGLAPRWGIIKVTSGSVSVDNDKVTGGEFTVDMKSLMVDPASVTEKDKKASDLEGHLKSADFFDADKHQTAKFVITKVEPYTSKEEGALPDANYKISGNLTLKDSTLNVTFPAKITATANDVVADAKFIIDRTAWGINYKAEGSPENWMIAKDVEIGLVLKAVK